ncbi:nuclear transport factor 2 family protein [bacterium]|nr:nuclear transport factor 2 family protein [bacterium]
MSPDPESVLRVVNKINESWLAKNYDEIGSCLDDSVIIAAPGSNNRIKGREAYVQSYRDYDTVAKTLQFNTEEPQIDIIGDTAVAICPFDITYELKDKIYHERGSEILILVRKNSEWRVVWRTMQSEPA